MNKHISSLPVIDARNLTKSFGILEAVRGVDLEVDEGEIFGLIGPDGAGKTTIMRLLCGALRPSSGECVIRIAGHDMIHDPETARAVIGYLPQRFSLYEEMTVLENLRFFAEVRGLSTREWKPRSMDILEFVDLAQFIDRRAGKLSGGMRQKLGLAAALVHKPQVLLLDEPTTGVDPVTRQDFWQLIIRLVGERRSPGQGTVVLVSTPYMDEAARCNRIAFMIDGKFIAMGTPEKIRSLMQEQVIELVGEPLNLLRNMITDFDHVVGVQKFGDRLHIRVEEDSAAVVIGYIQSEVPENDVRIKQLRVVRPQLEDVFMSLVGSRDA